MTLVGKVIQGDCLEVLPTLPAESIDLVLTDPPYGIDFQSARRTDWQRKDKIANDKEPFIGWLADAYRVTKNGGGLLCFCRWDVQEVFRVAIEMSGYQVKSQVIWDKGIHGMGDLEAEFAPQHEIILWATKGKFKFPDKRPTTMLSVRRVMPDKLLHPNEKPVGLLERLILATTKPGDVVLDCFAGSGSTLEASKKNSREYIGIELDPKYVEIANNRLKQEVLL